MTDVLPGVSNADLAIAQRLDPVMRLKPHQRRFVEAYVRTSNGAESARQAGYSPNGAAVRAKTLLEKPEIQQAIQELMVAQAISRNLTVDRLVTELAVIAMDRGTEEQHRLKAIDMLMRHLGAYNDRLQISLDDPDIIEAAQRYGVDPNELVSEMAQLAPIDTGQS